MKNITLLFPDGSWLSTSSLEVEGDQRLRFKFSGAQLKLPQRTVSLPPFGQGW
jgi:hypothetical protein